MKKCGRCKESIDSSSFLYHKSTSDNLGTYCKPCRSDYNKELNLRQPEVRVKNYNKNKDKIKIQVREWQKNNKSRVNFHNNNRRTKVKISPGEEARVQMLYHISSWITQHVGVIMNVDHIIPLARGGKHVLSNLQVITQEENFKKGCKVPEGGVS